MPQATVPVPVQAQPPDTAARPSWLPADAELPDQPAAAPTAPTFEAPSASYAPDYAEPQPAPAAWMASQAPPGNRNMAMLAAAAALVLLVGGGGIYAISQAMSRNSSATSGGNAVAASPTIVVSPVASPVPPTAPLTGQMGGDFCPVSHPNDAACWKGSFLNTGPAIRQLAITFVIGGGYDDWFAHHANGTLSGFYTTAGCDVEPAKSRIVCGSLGPGAQVDVYLGGDVTTRGKFNYAVKFADISSGSPVYVNQHPDGTHDVVSWTEVVS